MVIGLFLVMAAVGMLFAEAVALKDGDDAVWRREFLPLPHELYTGK